MIKHTEQEIKGHARESAIHEIENLINGDDIRSDVAYLLSRLKSHYWVDWCEEHGQTQAMGLSEQDAQEFLEEERKVDHYAYNYLVQMIREMYHGLKDHEEGGE